MNDVTLARIAALLGGVVRGNPERTVRGVAPPDAARRDTLCVVWQRKLVDTLAEDVPLLAPRGAVAGGRDGVEVDDPRAALPDVLPLFAPARSYEPGIHPTAVVHKAAYIDPSATVGPHCAVGRNARILAHAILEAHVFAGDDVVVGEGARVEPQVVLYHGTELGRNVVIHGGTVLGADGFGFVPDGAGGHRKIPQIGRVVIEDDVEIGAKCTVDRATIGETRVGRGTKIDDHVHIGHNCRIGANCLLVAFVGLAGSVTLEDNVVLAATAGVNPHVTIGRGAVVGGRGGVTTDVPPGQFVSGFPAQEHKAELRLQALVRKLPRLYERVARLERSPAT